MANELALHKEYSANDIQLIKDTVAKGATDSELKLFLYRCKNMGLDPLKPGQIYFIKYNSSASPTMVVGLDGMRAQAIRSGKHRGTRRGILKDENGKLIGGWAEVFRSDWDQPAREEVMLDEYNTGKAMWAKMPGSMVKKVAEMAALRMAFPDELSGLYGEEEMEHSQPIKIKAEWANAGTPPEQAILQEDIATIENEAIGYANQIAESGNVDLQAKILDSINAANGNLTAMKEVRDRAKGRANAV